MKSKNFIIASSLLLLLFSSCSTISKIMPYYTEPGKLAMLKTGMDIEEINKTLGVEPYNIYHIQEDGSSVLVYTYRIKMRKAKYSSGQIANDAHHSESSQTEGQPYYDQENKAYVLLSDGKLKSLITDKGLKESRAIVIKNNLLKLIGEEEFIEYTDRRGLWSEKLGEDNLQIEKIEEDSYNGEIVIPLRAPKQGRVKNMNIDVE